MKRGLRRPQLAVCLLAGMVLVAMSACNQPDGKAVKSTEAVPEPLFYEEVKDCYLEGASVDADEPYPPVKLQEPYKFCRWHKSGPGIWYHGDIESCRDIPLPAGFNLDGKRFVQAPSLALSFMCNNTPTLFRSPEPLKIASLDHSFGYFEADPTHQRIYIRGYSPDTESHYTLWGLQSLREHFGLPISGLYAFEGMESVVYVDLEHFPYADEICGILEMEFNTMFSGSMEECRLLEPVQKTAAE